MIDIFFKLDKSKIIDSNFIGIDKFENINTWLNGQIYQQKL